LTRLGSRHQSGPLPGKCIFLGKVKGKPKKERRFRQDVFLSDFLTLAIDSTIFGLYLYVVYHHLEKKKPGSPPEFLEDGMRGRLGPGNPV
jgi:hypothetical protein